MAAAPLAVRQPLYPGSPRPARGLAWRHPSCGNGAHPRPPSRHGDTRMRRKIGDLKLLPLLAATKWMIRRAAKRSPRVRALLREEQFTFQIVTRSGAGG